MMKLESITLRLGLKSLGISILIYLDSTHLKFYFKKQLISHFQTL
jgi:hypothetical protein